MEVNNTMGYELIKPSERERYRCHFCGETRSVKYIVSVYDPVVRSNGISKVTCCNMCFARYLTDKREDV